MLGNGMAAADTPEQQTRRGGARPSETVARPSPHSPPVNPEMFGNDLRCSPNTAHANIQPCNCAATATSCGVAEIAPAVCPICHGRRTERGRADIRRDVNIDTARMRIRMAPDGTPD